MLLSSYETHNFSNPHLPFICHPHYHLDGGEVETNWHKNIEIIYCFQGSGYVRCGTEIYNITANDLVVINSDILHTIGSSTSLDYSCLIVGSSFCADNGLNTEELMFHNVIQDPELVGLMKDITNIYKNFNSRELCAVADYRYAVLGLLRKLCRRYCSRKAVNSAETSTEYVKKAITYIRTNMAQKLTLDDLSAHVGISKYHLSREFKALTGSTVVNFINVLRCSEAKRLIEKGMRVSSAAYACGFENLSYFSRTFQRIIGTVPSSFST